MLKIYVYDSRNTMIPVQGVNVQFEDASLLDHMGITDNEGKIIFNENRMTTPALYRIILDNDPTWIFEYEITEDENTFIYYEDERGVN